MSDQQQSQLPVTDDELVAALHHYVATDRAMRDAQRAHMKSREQLVELLRRFGIDLRIGL